MSDDPREPEAEAAESTQRDADEGPKLREIDDDELEAQLKKHNEWLESVRDEEEEVIEKRLRIYMEKSTWDNRPGANLQSTKPPGENFKETDLRWANFRRADLQGADFRRANLRGTHFFDADLRKVDLRVANLAKADLQRADLREAQLLGANLRDANLQDADLRDVTGLLGKPLAGTNVSGAVLPNSIAVSFDTTLMKVEDLSQKAHQIFFGKTSFFLGCAISLYIIMETKDEDFFRNNAVITIPVLNFDIDIVTFYTLGPIILLGLFFFSHIQLQRIWRMVATLPAILPDGRRLDDVVESWLIRSLIQTHIPMLKIDQELLSKLYHNISLIFLWSLVPITIFFYWMRFLTARDWGGTIFSTYFINVRSAVAT